MVDISNWYDFPSNFSGGEQVNGLGSYIQYINYITNNGLAVGFLVIIWLSMFVFGMVGLMGFSVWLMG